ncbi:sugar porter family MFS transporter [Acuticoccus sediminis]|uniref:sugar porter family MFS transporter n=1 Tax=Acuticoccus sediminis TaxID=2184697 RepID=UPI001CFDB07A|nr:sugar porter family MFS transporter [Acuticoccus sediminis]
MADPAAHGGRRSGAIAAPVLLTGAVTTVFGLMFGFSTAVIAGVLDDVAAVYGLDTGATEAVVTSLVISCFFGAILASPLSARLGRKPALAIAGVLALAGYAAILAGPTLAVLVAGRIAIGLAVGLSSMVAPMYAAEATPARFRGAVVSLYQLAVTVGILAAYATPLFLSAALVWNQLVGLGVIIGVMGIVVAFAVPESPLWLSRHGRTAEAEAAARFLGVADVARHAAPEEGGAVRLAAVMAGSIPMVLTLAGGMFILQNLSGIDGILYYAPKIFEGLGFEAGTAALTATFVLGAVNVAATVGAILAVDRCGRRPLLLGGSAVMVAGLSAVVFALLTGNALAGFLGLALYIAAFAVSLGPLPYVMMSELFPSRIREPGIAAASATSWLFNAAVAFFFLSAVETFGSVAVFGFFAAVCVLSFLVGLFAVPETRGVPLEDIEARVLAGTPLRHLGE